MRKLCLAFHLRSSGICPEGINFDKIVLLNMLEEKMSENIPIKLDYSYLAPEVTLKDLKWWQTSINLAHEQLHNGTGAGSDFLGWMKPSVIMPENQLKEIKDTVKKLQKSADIMVVVGIGGSYLGARTVIEALGAKGAPEVIYAGQTLSGDYTANLLNYLSDKRFCINVVSKSGTTTEPAIAFRLLKNLLEKNVGKEAAKDLIVASTDPKDGALRQMSDNEGYVTFPIPKEVGGRYSVFTAVGILPIAFAGIDVDEFVKGAINCAEYCARETSIEKNPAYLYAALRNHLYGQGKSIEIMATFEPRLRFLSEWWKQLYGESEGKDGMGIFPASVEFTTDLHSMGQMIQDGRRNIFETFITIDGGMPSVIIPKIEVDLDELNYLAGLDINEVNKRAYQGTALAHRDGGVPSMTFILSELSELPFGALLYFFEKACGISGYLLRVNPFDQEGVEAYKKNMFALMNKKGSEDMTVKVTAAIKEKAGKSIANFE
jgi:glucose-6-phosphate isomerase